MQCGLGLGFFLGGGLVSSCNILTATDQRYFMLPSIYFLLAVTKLEFIAAGTGKPWPHLLWSGFNSAPLHRYG